MDKKITIAPVSFSGFIENYERYYDDISDLIEKGKEYNAKYETLKNDFQVKDAACDTEKITVLNKIKSNYLQERQDLDLKLKKLQAEVFRYETIFQKGDTKYGKMTDEIQLRVDELKQAIKDLIDIKLDILEQTTSDKIIEIKEEFQNKKNEIINNYRNNSANLRDDVKVEFEKESLNEQEAFFDRQTISSNIEKLYNNISIFDSKNYSPLLEIGSFRVETDVVEKISREIKVLIPFIDSKSLLIIFDDKTENKVKNILVNLLSRVLLSTEVGKIQLILSDLKDLGQIFRELIPLTHEILKEAHGSANFKKELDDCNNRLHTVFSKYTSSSKNSNFLSLGEYNYHQITHNKAEELAPHHIQVVHNLSYDTNEQQIRELNRLINNGIKNGTNFIITWNKNDENEKSEKWIESIAKNTNVLTIDFVGNLSNYLSIKHELVPNVIDEKKLHELVYSLNIKHSEFSKNIVKERFINTVPTDKNLWFNCDASELISVPIGKSKSHRGEQTIILKTKDFQSHLMLSGGTGSGKTNFLKTFITSAALHYSPEEIEFYLVDLKNGVGFDAFRKYQLPQVKLFAMGAENELILNLLQELNDEMNHRLNLLTQAGVDDIVEYNKRNPNNKIKRTLLIVDEFASVFEDDDDTAREIVAKISPLVRKARAVGINLFFSTQNFGRTQSFSSLFSEIPVRIVLKSSQDAASYLLGGGNDAMKYVETIGDGVLNYKAGIKLSESDNEFFKGYLLENDDLEIILTNINKESERRGFAKNQQMVYDNISNADFSKNAEIFQQKRVETFIDENDRTITKVITRRKIPIWLGEPTTISKTHFKMDLERNFNENILITGKDKSVSINAMYNILSSLSYAFASGEIAIRIISFLSEEENTELQLHLLNQLSVAFDYKFCDLENYEQELKILHTEVERRSQQNNTQAKRIFVFYVGLEKARKMQKVGYDETEQAEMFKKILSEGNNYNMHSIVEVMQPSFLGRISRNDLIGNFVHRIIFHLGSSDESRGVLGNNKAAHLYKADEPHTKFRAVYFNSNFEGVLPKIKPYIDLINSDDFTPKNFGKEYLNNTPIIDVIHKRVESSNEEIKAEEKEVENKKLEFSVSNENLAEIDYLMQLSQNSEDTEDEVIDIDDFFNRINSYEKSKNVNDENLAELEKLSQQLKELDEEDEVIDIDDFFNDFTSTETTK
ncbi:FtsK/SpoIIIE domain-containing protein [Capnocytophaga canimorsus]|uniref:FtsK domain-containing protein n=1 Tax=Capnocytophaga canimorsus (strain 5) TaxID=860228 RepID=F9YPM3_CAPCC|nr:FtsK/SpoIIIE domain-containing protein [Capnocytophaga canimorsus]AEK23369.1 Hypothetical protein Ccan_12530 [Capnocytophaga canimorsus Cc5]VEJ18456.1 DNA translocase FtsK [Capnocytophaga canimorsus]